MKLLVLDTQSISDVVTNSSSEVFILNNNKTCEEVNNILQSFTTGFRYPELFDLEDYRKWKKSTKDEDVDFHYPYSLYEFIRGYFYDSDDEDDVINYRNDFLFYPYNYTFGFPTYGGGYYERIQVDFAMYLNKRKEEVKKYIPEFKNATPETIIYGDYPFGKLPKSFYKEFYDSYRGELPKQMEIPDKENVKNLDGKILVLSENDNTIPFDDFDKINELFNGYNIHLG